jgi:hypothetical protein
LCRFGRAHAQHHPRRHFLFSFKEEQEEQEKEKFKKSFCDRQKYVFRVTRPKRLGSGTSGTRPHRLPPVGTRITARLKLADSTTLRRRTPLSETETAAGGFFSKGRTT